jgi:hypothetical protein
MPTVVPVTVTLKVQVPPGAIDAPLSDIVRVAATTVTVPLQAEKVALATDRPAGSTSVNATPVRVVEELALVIVNVSEVLPFRGIFAAPKALLMLGGPTTLMLAEAVLPVPPLLDVTLPVTLFCKPVALPVTVTLKVQVPPGAIDAPLSEIVRVAAVVVTVPLQAAKLPLATLNPAGSTSVNATPARVVVVFELVIVKVNVVVPFSGTDAAPNALLMLGAATTVRVAEAVLPVPPLADVTLPVTLFFTPAVAPVTVTLKVQVPPGAIDAPLSEIVRVAATVVTVPLQAEKLASTMLSPVGRTSVKATPVRVLVELVLVMVNVRVDVPPTAIEVGLKALLIEGAPTTVMLAEAVLPVPPLLDVTLPVVLV